MSLPITLKRSIHAHRGGAKCVATLGSDASAVVTGGSDGLVKILDPSTGSVIHTLTGHTSRIWDVDCSLSGDMIASASGDATVKIWSSSGGALSTLGGEGGDVYGVRFRPTHTASPNHSAGSSSNGGGLCRHVTTASYDRILRTYDVETSALIRTFSGHSLAALFVAYDPVGTLMASGAKDRQVRLWDAVGGVCVNILSGCLGEVTSVEFDLHGRYLLVGSKDNANRLWDLRMVRLYMTMCRK
jgi:WD40 repeat protein